MSEQRGFSLDTVRRANMMMRENEREKELQEPRMELHESKRPFRAVGLFFYGVLQHFIGMCLTTLLFYIILKMSGSWDILLNNLFK